MLSIQFGNSSGSSCSPRLDRGAARRQLHEAAACAALTEGDGKGVRKTGRAQLKLPAVRIHPVERIARFFVHLDLLQSRVAHRANSQADADGGILLW